MIKNAATDRIDQRLRFYVATEKSIIQFNLCHTNNRSLFEKEKYYFHLKFLNVLHSDMESIYLYRILLIARIIYLCVFKFWYNNLDLKWNVHRLC